MKKILFLEREGSCLSQMAEGFVRRFGRDVAEVKCAGMVNAPQIDKMAAAVMRERGIETDGWKAEKIEGLKGEEFDVCVNFGAWDEGYGEMVSCENRRSWDDFDPGALRQYSDYRRVREEIGSRVMAMLRELRENR